MCIIIILFLKIYSELEWEVSFNGFGINGFSLVSIVAVLFLCLFCLFSVDGELLRNLQNLHINHN